MNDLSRRSDLGWNDGPPLEFRTKTGLQGHHRAMAVRCLLDLDPISAKNKGQAPPRPLAQGLLLNQ